MRYGLSCLLLLGLAAPTFVTAADTDAVKTTTSTTPPALSTPPAGVSGSEPSAAPKNDSAASADVKPDLGLEASDTPMPSSMEEDTDSTEVKKSKKKKLKKLKKVAKKSRKSRRGKRHHARNRKSCGGMVDEAYKAQTALFMNKECAPVVTTCEPVAISCDPSSSCAPAAEVK